MTLGHEQYPDVSSTPAVCGHLERLGCRGQPGSTRTRPISYLGVRLCDGDPRAIAAFDRELIPVITNAAQKIDRAPHFVDEVMQARARTAADRERGQRAADRGIRRRGAAARVGTDRGDADAMNLLRDRKTEMLVDDEAFFDVVGDGTDVHKKQERAMFAQACSDALRAAFAKLSARERNLLRMHHLHGLTVDELAPMFRVHRATVARWITSAREHLLTETRDSLRDRLAIGEDTVTAFCASSRDRSKSPSVVCSPNDSRALTAWPLE